MEERDMARIVFEMEVDSHPDAVVAALDTADGIAGWWTEDVSFEGGPGSTMKLGFRIAPQPFELRVDEVGTRRVSWTSVGDFPPHWAGTRIVWTLRPATAQNETTTVHFSHDGWASDEGLLPAAAMTWGQLMVSLKHFIETGAGEPLFRRG
jgi:uncharacterized protein YndB with AHSA1/START domain